MLSLLCSSLDETDKMDTGSPILVIPVETYSQFHGSSGKEGPESCALALMDPT